MYIIYGQLEIVSCSPLNDIYSCTIKYDYLYFIFKLNNIVEHKLKIKYNFTISKTLIILIYGKFIY